MLYESSGSYIHKGDVVKMIKYSSCKILFFSLHSLLLCIYIFLVGLGVLGSSGFVTT